MKYYGPYLFRSLKGLELTDTIILVTMLITSTSALSFIILPVLFLDSIYLKRLLFYLFTLTTSASSASFLNLILHLLSQKPAVEHVTLEIFKLIFSGFSSEMIFLAFFSSVISLILEKDQNLLKLLTCKYQENYSNYKNITENLEIPFVFMKENGEMLKFNNKADKIFTLDKKKNFFDTIQSHQVHELKRMMKIAQQKLIPEEDFNHSIPDIGKFYHVLTMKYVQLNDINAYLINLHDVNFSAKKRVVILNSFLAGATLQQKLLKKFTDRYNKYETISTKDFCIFLKYIYSQQETIFITQLLIGEVVTERQNFDIKHEIANIVHFYWENLKKAQVSLRFDCLNLVNIVNGDKIKHHLLIKSLLTYISHLAEAGTDVKIFIKSGNVNEVQYLFQFTSENLTEGELQSVFLLPENDIDQILVIQKRFGTVLCLFPSLMKFLNGSIDMLQIINKEARIGFSLKFSEGNPYLLKQFYLFDSLQNENELNWPINARIISRKPICKINFCRKLIMSCACCLINQQFEKRKLILSKRSATFS